LGDRVSTELVFLKAGDQTDAGAELYRLYEREHGHRPPFADSPNFEWLVGRRFTVAVVRAGSWWDVQLTELGWRAIDLDEWLRLFDWASDPKNRSRLATIAGARQTGQAGDVTG